MSSVPSPLVVAGHSQINAFAPPPDHPSAPVIVEAGEVQVVHGPEPRDDAYWRAFATAAPGAPRAIVWQGDQHVRTLLVEPVPPLDFVLSAAPDLPLDPRASYVAEAQLRALFAPSMAPLPDVLRLVRDEAKGAPVLLAGTPPPIGEGDAIAQRLPADPQFAALLVPGERGVTPTLTLTSPYTLQKVWSLLQMILAEIAAANGATFVPVPDRTRNLEGFLAPAFWGDDPVHANAAFARELAADLRAAAAQPKEAIA